MFLTFETCNPTKLPSSQDSSNCPMWTWFSALSPHELFSRLSQVAKLKKLSQVVSLSYDWSILKVYYFPSWKEYVDSSLDSSILNSQKYNEEVNLRTLFTFVWKSSHSGQGGGIHVFQEPWNPGRILPLQRISVVLESRK